MEVKPVDSRTQFNGYIDKSLIKFVNGEMKARCYKMAEDAAVIGKTVNPEEIAKVKALRDGILKKFSNFMSDLQEKTVMVYRRGPEGVRSDICMENPVSDRMITVASTNTITEYSLTMHQLPGENLEVLNNVADRLLRRNPQEFNNDFLSFAEAELSHMYRDNSSLLSLITKKKAKKLDAYARSIGDSNTNHLKTAEARYNAVRETEKKRSALFNKSKSLIDKIIGGK